MFESKKNKVSICVKPTKATQDIAVCLSFKLEINSCVVSHLFGLDSSDCNHPDKELACIAQALHREIQNKLYGDPLSAKKSKVTHVNFGAHNGCVYYSWTTKGTVSNTRKTLGLAIKALKPANLKSIYKFNCKRYGLSPKDEYFNYAAKKMLDGINAGVECLVVGNIKINDKKLKDMLDTVSKKLDAGQVKGKGVPNKENKENKECKSDYATIKVSGWKAFVTKYYIVSKKKNIVPVLCGKCIKLPIKQSTYDSLKKDLKANLSKFMKQKYKKLGSDIGPIIGYIAIANGDLGSADAKKLVSLSDSKALIEIEKAIKENL